MRMSKNSITFDGMVSYVKGSRAVICNEFIISKRGYIDTPNRKDNQPFVAIIASSAFYVVSGSTLTILETNFSF